MITLALLLGIFFASISAFQLTVAAYKLSTPPNTATCLKCLAGAVLIIIVGMVLAIASVNRAS